MLHQAFPPYCHAGKHRVSFYNVASQPLLGSSRNTPPHWGAWRCMMALTRRRIATYKRQAQRRKLGKGLEEIEGLWGSPFFPTLSQFLLCSFARPSLAMAGWPLDSQKRSWQPSNASSYQGCALADDNGPWWLTFEFRRHRNHSLIQ